MEKQKFLENRKLNSFLLRRIVIKYNGRKPYICYIEKVITRLLLMKMNYKRGNRVTVFACISNNILTMNGFLLIKLYHTSIVNGEMCIFLKMVKN